MKRNAEKVQCSNDCGFCSKIWCCRKHLVLGLKAERERERCGDAGHEQLKHSDAS